MMLATTDLLVHKVADLECTIRPTSSFSHIINKTNFYNMWHQLWKLFKPVSFKGKNDRSKYIQNGEHSHSQNKLSLKDKQHTLKGRDQDPNIRGTYKSILKK